MLSDFARNRHHKPRRRDAKREAIDYAFSNVKNVRQRTVSTARVARAPSPAAFASATQTAADDQAFHADLYLRVVMLVSAVLVGLLIVRVHSRTHSRVQSEYAEESSKTVSLTPN